MRYLEIELQLVNVWRPGTGVPGFLSQDPVRDEFRGAHPELDHLD